MAQMYHLWFFHYNGIEVKEMTVTKLTSTNRCVPGLKTRLYEFRQAHAFYCVYTIQHQLRTLQWLPAFFLDYKTSLEGVTS